jgi:hypothetical protein
MGRCLGWHHGYFFSTTDELIIPASRVRRPRNVLQYLPRHTGQLGMLRLGMPEHGRTLSLADINMVLGKDRSCADKGGVGTSIFL